MLKLGALSQSIFNPNSERQQKAPPLSKKDVAHAPRAPHLHKAQSHINFSWTQFSLKLDHTQRAEYFLRGFLQFCQMLLIRFHSSASSPQ